MAHQGADTARDAVKVCRHGMPIGDVRQEPGAVPGGRAAGPVGEHGQPASWGRATRWAGRRRDPHGSAGGRAPASAQRRPGRASRCRPGRGGASGRTFRSSAVYVPQTGDGLVRTGDEGGIRWIYAFSSDAEPTACARARNYPGAALRYLTISGSRMLDVAVPAVGRPCGVSLDVASTKPTNRSSTSVGPCRPILRDLRDRPCPPAGFGFSARVDGVSSRRGEARPIVVTGRASTCRTRAGSQALRVEWSACSAGCGC